MSQYGDEQIAFPVWNNDFGPVLDPTAIECTVLWMHRVAWNNGRDKGLLGRVFGLPMWAV